MLDRTPFFYGSQDIINSLFPKTFYSLYKETKGLCIFVGALFSDALGFPAI